MCNVNFVTIDKVKQIKLEEFYFHRFGKATPIYVNIVRDPVERVISWFYYVRAPWYFVERKRAFPDLPLPDTDWLKKDFETCVLTGDPECVYHQNVRHEGIGDHRRQTLFFCGHENNCLYVQKLTFFNLHYLNMFFSYF